MVGSHVPNLFLLPEGKFYLYKGDSMIITHIAKGDTKTASEFVYISQPTIDSSP